MSKLTDVIDQLQAELKKDALLVKESVVHTSEVLLEKLMSALDLDVAWKGDDCDNSKNDV